jgi:hypothetical protein
MPHRVAGSRAPEGGPRSQRGQRPPRAGHLHHAPEPPTGEGRTSEAGCRPGTCDLPAAKRCSGSAKERLHRVVPLLVFKSRRPGSAAICRRARRVTLTRPVRRLGCAGRLARPLREGLRERRRALRSRPRWAKFWPEFPRTNGSAFERPEKARPNAVQVSSTRPDRQEGMAGLESASGAAAQLEWSAPLCPQTGRSTSPDRHCCLSSEIGMQTRLSIPCKGETQALSCRST